MYKRIVLLFPLLWLSISAMKHSPRKMEDTLCGYCLFENVNADEDQNRPSRSGSLPGLLSSVHLSPRNKPQYFCEKISFGSDEGLILFGFFEDLLPEEQAPHITQLAKTYLLKEFQNVKFERRDTPKTRLLNVFTQLEEDIKIQQLACGVVGILGVVTNDKCICASLGDSSVFYGAKKTGSRFITKPHIPKPDTSEYARVISKGGEVQKEIVRLVKGGRCIVDCKKVESKNDSKSDTDASIVRETYWVCEKSLSRSTSLASLMQAQGVSRIPTSGMLGCGKFKKIGVTATPKVFECNFSSDTSDAEFLLIANGNFWRVMHKHKEELSRKIVEQKIFSKNEVSLNTICRFVCMLATGKKTLGDLQVMLIPHPSFFNYESKLDGVNPDLDLEEWRS